MIQTKSVLVVGPFSSDNQRSLVLNANWPSGFADQRLHRFWLYHFRSYVPPAHNSDQCCRFSIPRESEKRATGVPLAAVLATFSRFLIKDWLQILTRSQHFLPITKLPRSFLPSLNSLNFPEPLSLITWGFTTTSSVQKQLVQRWHGPPDRSQFWDWSFVVRLKTSLGPVLYEFVPWYNQVSLSIGPIVHGPNFETSPCFGTTGLVWTEPSDISELV